MSLRRAHWLWRAECECESWDPRFARNDEMHDREKRGNGGGGGRREEVIYSEFSDC